MLAFILAVPVFLMLAPIPPQGGSLAAFRTADTATKTQILNNIATNEQRLGIAEVIALVREGMRDASPAVRLTALNALMVRTVASRWAGTPGPMVGPSPMSSGQRRVIPADWKGDAERLRDALEGDCLAVLKGDPDNRVRHDALLAMGNLERPLERDAPFRTSFVDLLAHLYRDEPDLRIRVEALKALRLASNDTPEVRAVLRDGLVDRNPSVREEALRSIVPQPTRRQDRPSFADVRAALDAALKNADAGVRRGAVQALNAFGAESVSYVGTLERLSGADPDAQVRVSSQLAVEAIQRAARR